MIVRKHPERGIFSRWPNRISTQRKFSWIFFPTTNFSICGCAIFASRSKGPRLRIVSSSCTTSGRTRHHVSAPGEIRHIYHGSRDNRRYRTRHDSLAAFGLRSQKEISNWGITVYTSGAERRRQSCAVRSRDIFVKDAKTMTSNRRRSRRDSGKLHTAVTSYLWGRMRGYSESCVRQPLGPRLERRSVLVILNRK